MAKSQANLLGARSSNPARCRGSPTAAAIHAAITGGQHELAKRLRVVATFAHDQLPCALKPLNEFAYFPFPSFGVSKLPR